MTTAETTTMTDVRASFTPEVGSTPIEASQEVRVPPVKPSEELEQGTQDASIESIADSNPEDNRLPPSEPSNSASAVDDSQPMITGSPVGAELMLSADDVVVPVSEPSKTALMQPNAQDTMARLSVEIPKGTDADECTTPTAETTQAHAQIETAKAEGKSSWAASGESVSPTQTASETESPCSQNESTVDRTSIDLLSELSHPFKPMVPLQSADSDTDSDADTPHIPAIPPTIPDRLPVLPHLNVQKAAEADVAQPELSPISILRSPYDFLPRTIQKPLVLGAMSAASDEDAITPVQGAPSTAVIPASSKQTPTSMLVQPRPQHAHIPLLSLEVPDFASPPPSDHSHSQLSHPQGNAPYLNESGFPQSSHGQLQPQRRPSTLSTLSPQNHPSSLQPARLNLGQRRHSSANVASPITDSPYGPNGYGYGFGNGSREEEDDDGTALETPGGGQLVPVYHPGLRRFSLMDGGPQVASARLGLARRTSRESNGHASSVSGHGQIASEESTTIHGMDPSLAVPIPRIRSIGDLSTIREPTIDEDGPSSSAASPPYTGIGGLGVVGENEGEETRQFPAGAAGDITLSLDFDLMSGDGHRMPRPSTQRRAYQRSISSDAHNRQAGIAEEGNQGEGVEGWGEGVARPRPRSHLRPDAERAQLDARRHSVARWSTFEEMGIQSFALAQKKGEKTVDSASRRSVLAKLEAEELKKQHKREEAALKKRGRKSVVLNAATIGFGGRDSSGGGGKGTMSRPSSSTGSQGGTGTGTNSGAPSVSEASLERDSTSTSLRSPPGLGALLGGERSRNASMPALGASLPLTRSPSLSANIPPLPNIQVSSSSSVPTESITQSESREASPALNPVGLPVVHGVTEAAQSTVSLAMPGEKKNKRGRIRKRSPLAQKGEKATKSGHGCIIM